LKIVLYIVILFGIICGILFPHFAVLSITIPYLIGILLYINFLEMHPVWRRFFRKELCVTGGILMLIFSRFIPHKDYDLIISNFFTTQFGIILYFPLMAQYVLGAAIKIDTSHLFYQTAALVLIPYICGLLSRSVFSNRIVDQLKRIGNRSIPILVFLTIAISISLTTQEIDWSPELVRLSAIVFVIYMLQGSAACLAGTLLGDKSIRNTLALTASSRNTQLVLGLAVINFPPLVIVPLVLSVIFHHVTNVIWLWLFRK